MSIELLTPVYKNVCRTECYSIGSHRVTRAFRDDYYTLCNGITLWCGVLLDFDVWLVQQGQKDHGFTHRILTMPVFCGVSTIDLSILLSFLDQLDDELIAHLSTDTPFKEEFRFRTKAPTQFGVVKGMCNAVALLIHRHTTLVKEGVSLIHQVLSLLHKINIDRPDLRNEAYASFIEFEDSQPSRDALLDHPDAVAFIREMNALARIHLKDFKPSPLYPRHGPGSVSTSGIHSKYDKYLNMCTDARISYLLTKNGLGTEVDYNPWVRSTPSNRTSRFVAVPKTWKKLRGISAEPIELQFYQQALLRSFDTMFHHDLWWRQRVNLHDQARSRKLALLGSIHEGYATIDLSAASDSVSLELVKRVFKGTPLLLWLLGTRSTSTTCNGSVVRLRKFAPMGSACCFPVECVIFALAAQVASDRTRSIDEDSPSTVCVFGDDIIVDWYSASHLVDMLEGLGFQVNTRKSYLSGKFREACGVEAFRGLEIQPLRYKSLKGDFLSWTPNLETISTATSYCNSLYNRGLHMTREFLLYHLLRSRITIGRKTYRYGRYALFTFSGMLGTIASHSPTNFGLVAKAGSADLIPKRKPYYGYPLRYQIGYRLRDRLPLLTLENSNVIQDIDYHEWLLSHSMVDSDESIESQDDDIHFLDELCSPLWDASRATIVPVIRLVHVIPRILDSLI